MENRPFGPEEQDDSTPDVSAKKKRSGSKLSQYLLGIRRREHEENSETDAGDEKPKRLRRIFSRLFPRMVERPDQSSVEAPDHGFDADKWFSWTRFANQAESEDVTETTEAGEMSNVEDLPDYSRADNAREAVEQPSNIAHEVSRNSVSNSVEDIGERPHGADSVTEVEEEAPAHVAEQHIAAQPIEAITRGPTEIQGITPQVLRPEDESTREVVIERGPGMVLPVALVGLEHLGRKKADKKLEKRVSEKIEATNREVGRGAALQQELETLTRQNKEQLEMLKQSREGKPSIEVPKQPSRTTERPMAQSPERVVVAEQPKAPERHVRIPELKERPRATAESEIKEVQPEKILEQVAEAAEHDMPVERIFERSHEVKDDKTVTGAAASVGAVVNAHATLSKYTAGPKSSPVSSRADGSLPFVADPKTAAAYKQAVRMGFWTAVMIIILGSIAYLVVK